MRALRVAWLAGLGLLAAAAARADVTRIVILPIVVHSSAANTDYVSRGLADMLAARLEQAEDVRVVQVEGREAAVSKLPAALAAGRKAGGDWVIFGAFTQFGEGASLDMQCVSLRVPDAEAAQASRRIFIQSGTMAEIIPKLDELADRVVLHVTGKGLETANGTSEAAGVAQSQEELRKLRERVEALEHAVFPAEQGAAGASATPAAKGSAVPGGAAASSGPKPKPAPES